MVNGAPREVPQVLNGVPREYIEGPLGVFFWQTLGLRPRVEVEVGVEVEVEVEVVASPINHLSARAPCHTCHLSLWFRMT